MLIGVASLRWSDVTSEDAPTLFKLVGQGAAGSVTVRSVRSRTCSIDAWLTISAGRRAADTEGGYCRQIPRATFQADRSAQAGSWQALSDYQRTQKYDSTLGVLGDALQLAGTCATAVGPGAALALARADGTVDDYVASPGELTGGLIARCPVTVIDLGAIPHQKTTKERRAAVARLDAAVARVFDLMPRERALIVAGIADAGPMPVPPPGGPAGFPPPALRVGIVAGDAFEGRWLTATSTRWTGLVQLTDLTPTVIDAAGAERPDVLVGQPWRPGEPHPPTAAETISQLMAADTAAQVFRKQAGAFYQYLGLVQAVVYLGALAWLIRGLSTATRISVLRAVQTVALAAAALPVASFLTNISKWWRFEHPDRVLWPSVIVISFALAALAAAGPWRRFVYGPPAFLAAVTVVVLATDVLTGSNLQHSSLLGLSPLTAGRFYGFGNIPFGIFAASLIFLCGALASWLGTKRVSPAGQAVMVLLVGLGGVAVVGSPSGGADFGGVLASLPGVAVLALGVAGIALNLRWVLGVGLLAVMAVTLVSLVDWLRPAASRSHFGEFAQQIFDGTAWPIVRRKLLASLGTLGNPYSWFVPVAYAVIARYVLMTGHDRPMAVEELEARWPSLRPTMLAALVTGFVGFAVNDSGTTVPAMLLTVGIPLVMAALTAAAQLTPNPRDIKAARADATGSDAG